MDYASWIVGLALRVALDWLLMSCDAGGLRVLWVVGCGLCCFAGLKTLVSFGVSSTVK